MYLIFSNEDLHDTKIVKSLEDAGFLIKGVTETVEKEVNEKKRGFLVVIRYVSFWSIEEHVIR